jgi:benzoate/toluate 1,2-dioxygenase reductase component
MMQNKKHTPKKHTVKYIGKRKLTSDVFLFSFQKPENNFSFLSGQFCNIYIPLEIYTKFCDVMQHTPEEKPHLQRSYSLASHESFDEIHLIIKLIPNGLGSFFFHALQEGQDVSLASPFGGFMLSNNPLSTVFIATGTGVAPYIPMLEDLKQQNFTLPILFLYGDQYQEDIFMKKELESYTKDLDITFVYCLSKDTKTSSDIFSGRVTDYLIAHQKNIISFEHYYICGGGGMVTETRKILKEWNKTQENIFFEKFYA